MSTGGSSGLFTERTLPENLNTENGYLLGQPPKVKSIMNVTIYNIYLESFCG